MTGFLASVTTCEEAELALSTGADIIDCKDPAQGALGALPLNQIRAIVASVGRRRPVSATVGDLPSDPDRIEYAVRRVGACNVDFIKVGFFELDTARNCISTVAERVVTDRLIAVFFADRFDPSPLIPQLAQSGFQGVMIDTANKSDRGLTDLWNQAQLSGFVHLAGRYGLLCGLAGKLDRHDIPELLQHRPDYLGFRSALCEQGRTGKLSRNALTRVRNAIARSPDRQSSEKSHGPCETLV